jgi:peptidoglycan/LPS O-acetylase OafA/YrhL
MEHLAMVWDGIPESFGLWMFLSIGAVALFVVFIPLVSWIDSRRKEREAFYKADTLRRLAEASGEGARAALDMLRGEERLKAIRAREGLKIGGLVNVGVGIGLSIMLYSIADGVHGPYLVGAIPGLVGVALLVYVYVMAEPIERI